MRLSIEEQVRRLAKVGLRVDIQELSDGMAVISIFDTTDRLLDSWSVLPSEGEAEYFVRRTLARMVEQLGFNLNGDFFKEEDK